MGPISVLARFILLNLAFSTQAAYAAPLILLAQTRQADRDKAIQEAADAHREEIATAHQELLTQNTKLTEEVHQLALVIHESLSAYPRNVQRLPQHPTESGSEMWDAEHGES